MDSIVSLPANIVAWLSDRSQLSDINFFTEFPPINKAVPLKQAIVAVGIKELKISDKFVENGDGVLERQEYCRTADILARLSICVPYSYGGSACHDIFTRIIDELTFNTDLNITESACEETQSDRNTSALVLNGTFSVKADFCPAEVVDSNYFSFLDKDFFCGSHLRDESIHVTAEEKEKWDSPFAVGFYFGNGENSKTLSLDFEPKLVLVFCNGTSPVEVDFDTRKIIPQFAIGTSSYNSQGITVLSGGFKVQKMTFGNSTAKLNEAGIMYGYAAMK